MKQFRWVFVVGGLILLCLSSLCFGKNTDLNGGEDWQSIVLPKAPTDVTKRIEQYRTKEVTLVIKNNSGKVFDADQIVTVELVRHQFLFGCNIYEWAGFNGDTTLQQKYRVDFAALFNYATLPFYWNWYEPEPGKTDQSTRSRDIATWCREQQIRPKGHPLIWHEMMPAWTQNMNPAEFEARLQARVKNIVSGFAGQIDTFDVINESLVSPNFNNPVGQWVKRVGPREAVRQSLSWARSANPKAYLLVNDFNTSADYASEITGLVKQGQAPNAIGIQSHMHKGAWSNGQIWETCERFKKLGIPVHFTETTIISGTLMALYDNDWGTTRSNWRTTSSGEQYQAKEVCRFYRMLFSHPAVEAITWWDFSDYGSWLGAPSGLLRRDLSHKPAYNVLMKLIHDEWRTHVSGKTDIQGSITFRGFFGRYRLTSDGKTIEFDLGKNSPDQMEIVLK